MTHHTIFEFRIFCSPFRKCLPAPSLCCFRSLFHFILDAKGDCADQESNLYMPLNADIESFIAQSPILDGVRLVEWFVKFHLLMWFTKYEKNQMHKFCLDYTMGVKHNNGSFCLNLSFFIETHLSGSVTQVWFCALELFSSLFSPRFFQLVY